MISTVNSIGLVFSKKKMRIHNSMTLPSSTETVVVYVHNSTYNCTQSMEISLSPFPTVSTDQSPSAPGTIGSRFLLHSKNARRFFLTSLESVYTLLATARAGESGVPITRTTRTKHWKNHLTSLKPVGSLQACGSTGTAKMSYLK